MGHEKRIVSAFTENAITRVLVIDDVYDPPIFSEVPGELLDFLDNIEGQQAARDAGLADPDLDAATTAATEGDIGAAGFEMLVQALYAKFVETRDGRFDPGGLFETRKGATLSVLEPLVALLNKCGTDVNVHLVGINDGETRFVEVQPQVVFLDYYLSAEAAGAGLTAAVKTKAKKASIELLGRLLNTTDVEDPAVVLMSSEQVKAEAQSFRRSVEEKGKNVLALRFRFLQKGWVTGDGKNLKIENEAADALLDTSQGYVFGQVLQRALKQWREGAEGALNALLKEIGSLEPKDFAYLFRFRLANEGERMGDYLEWLFGENLRATVAEKVDWKNETFVRLDDAALSKGVEGAFDGPSVPIAKLFHRVRVDGHVSRSRTRHSLGDIYIRSKDKRLLVVITPDCDLVSRNGKQKVDRVLTMDGELRSFNDESSSADEFIFYKQKPYSVRWNPKGLNTYPVSGKGSLDELTGIELLGTLRPLYAQEVQRQALSDLGRIGLAVAPTMGVDASVTVHLRVQPEKGEPAFSTLELDGKSMATVLPERGDAKLGHKVLLRRSFVHLLADKLKALDATTLTPADQAKLAEFLREKNEDQLISGFLIKGSPVKDKGPLGTSIVIGSKVDRTKDSPWLQLLLTLSDEAMEELLHVDPTLAITDELVT
jgi:hypothetical protein